MSHVPVNLSAVALRLAGEAGQAALDRASVIGATAMAELDQHVATVRSDLQACQQDSIGAPQDAAATAGYRAAQGRPASRWDSRAGRGPAEIACPDVPFVADARAPQAVLPLRLLLHYANGFVEAAVTADWWPAHTVQHRPDWESMRLAAVGRLISEAEAAAEIHPDLRALA